MVCKYLYNPSSFLYTNQAAATPNKAANRITTRPRKTCFFSETPGLNFSTKSRTTSVETEFKTAIREVTNAAIKEARTKPRMPEGNNWFSKTIKVCFVSSSSSPG